MFTVLRDYKVKPENMQRSITVIRNDIVPHIEALPGFVGYTIAKPVEDRLISISTWETEAQLEESTRRAGELINALLPGAIEGPPKVTRGRTLIRENRAGGGEGRVAVIRRFQVKPDEVESNVQKVREGLLPLLEGSPGWIAYAVLDCGGGDIVSLAAFESKENADAAAARAIAWSQRAMPGTQAVETIAAEIEHRRINPAVAGVR